jgi:hypothetical protein
MAEQAPSAVFDRSRRIAWFAFWNVLSFAAMFGIFFAVRDVEWWDGAFRACFRFFYQHETLAVMAALTPFLASLLVGWGYAQRARRRRARQALAAGKAAG